MDIFNFDGFKLELVRRIMGDSNLLGNNKEESSQISIFKKKIANYLQSDNDNEIDQCLQEFQPHFYKEFSEEILCCLLDLINFSKNVKGILYICEKILDKLMTFCDPGDLSLLISQNLCILREYTYFSFVLNSLKMCLIKVKDFSLTLNECTKRIAMFLIHLSEPNNQDFGSAKEESIIICYEQVLMFIDNVLVDLKDYFENDKNDGIEKVKNSLLDLLISMFGSPFCYLNEDHESVHSLQQNLLDIVSKIRYDKLYFFRYMKSFEYFKNYSSILKQQKKYNLEVNECGPFVIADNLAVSNFFCALFSSKNTQLVTVYCPLYVIASCINVSNYLMMKGLDFDSDSKQHMLSGNQRTALCTKAMHLANNILSFFNNVSMSQEWLALPIFPKFFDNLFLIAIRHLKDNRRFAVDTCSNYIDIFEAESKFLILLKILNYDDVDVHRIVKSHFVEKLKEILDNNFKDIELKNNFSKDIFTGSGLKLLLLNVCKFNEGDDIVDRSQELKSALNLILYLVTKDKQNKSGIKDFISEIDECFLRPLSKAAKKEQEYWSHTYHNSVSDIKSFDDHWNVKGENDNEHVMILINAEISKIYDQLYSNKSKIRN